MIFFIFIKAKHLEDENNVKNNLTAVNAKFKEIEKTSNAFAKVLTALVER